MLEGLKRIRDGLMNYDGEEISIMEVCGSHTAAITKSGIRNILSPKIKLISGPGCPVCVTPTAYIDRLCELALSEGKSIVSFGDMLRVPGSEMSLSQAKGSGADVRMVYSPIDIIKFAKAEPEREFVFAAVGFETTTPLYADLTEELIAEDIKNVKLLTALKTMPEIVTALCKENANIDGFLAPGHVCSVTGSRIFEPVSEKFNIPFAVAGFTPQELLVAIDGVIKHRGQSKVINYYPRAVSREGNVRAAALVDKYFEKCNATWRGMGEIANSGMKLRSEYAHFDAGSSELVKDIKLNKKCLCGEILMGRKKPENCPLFGRECTPLTPQGACMVSEEGSCRAGIGEKR